MARAADLREAYRRRADLIPNLVATMRAAAPDAVMISKIVEARAKAQATALGPAELRDADKVAEFQQRQDAPSAALDSVGPIAAAHPALQTNADFAALQNQLEGSANRIAVALRDYNDAAHAYDASLAASPFAGKLAPAVQFAPGGEAAAP